MDNNTIANLFLNAIGGINTIDARLSNIEQTMNNRLSAMEYKLDQTLNNCILTLNTRLTAIECKIENFKTISDNYCKCINHMATQMRKMKPSNVTIEGDNDYRIKGNNNNHHNNPNHHNNANDITTKQVTNDIPITPKNATSANPKSSPSSKQVVDIDNPQSANDADIDSTPHYSADDDNEYSDYDEYNDHEDDQKHNTVVEYNPTLSAKQMKQRYTSNRWVNGYPKFDPQLLHINLKRRQKSLVKSTCHSYIADTAEGEFMLLQVHIPHIWSYLLSPEEYKLYDYELISLILCAMARTAYVMHIHPSTEYGNNDSYIFLWPFDDIKQQNAYNQIYRRCIDPIRSNTYMSIIRKYPKLYPEGVSDEMLMNLIKSLYPIYQTYAKYTINVYSKAVNDNDDNISTKVVANDINDAENDIEYDFINDNDDNVNDDIEYSFLENNTKYTQLLSLSYPGPQKDPVNHRISFTKYLDRIKFSTDRHIKREHVNKVRADKYKQDLDAAYDDELNRIHAEEESLAERKRLVSSRKSKP